MTTVWRSSISVYVVCWSVVILISGTSVYGETARYTITDLGTLGGSWSEAYGINNQGQVCGMFGTSNGSCHAFLWQAGVMRDLFPPHYTWGYAWGINDMGQVVGGFQETDGGPIRPCLWENGALRDLGTLGARGGFAYGVNNVGQVVGTIEAADGTERPVLWQNGVGRDLGTLAPVPGAYGAANSINNLGQVVGYACNQDYYDRPFLWQNGVMKELETPSPWPPWTHTYPQSINEAGQIVGYGMRNYPTTRAFLWDKGTMTDLGADMQALDINAARQIVGGTSYHTQAFLWEGGVATNLNTLVRPDSGWKLNFANSINDRGQIVGEGTSPSGITHGFLLTSVPVVTPKPESPLPQTASRHPVTLPAGADRLRQYVSEVGAWGLFLPSAFDASKPTYVITHDGEKSLLHHSQLADMSAIAAAIKVRDPGANVVGWDWEDRESCLDRTSARRAVDEQGPLLAQALREIGIRADNTVLVGQGIGGHLVASAAASLAGRSGSNVERVVLLDTPMFWEFRGVPGQRSITQQLRAVDHVDNYYYGTRPAEDRYLAGEGQPIPEWQVFNADLDYRLPNDDGHVAVIPWYAESLSGERVDLQGNYYGIKIDGVTQDALTHQREGFFYESYLLLEGYLINSSDTAAKGLELWKAIPAIVPSGINLLDSLESWSGCHATPVDVLAGNRHSITAVELREASDAYIWKEVAIPQEVAYLGFDVMFLGGADGDELVVTFDDETLFRGDGSFFDELFWTNSGPIPIADLAGRTGILQFWLKSSGDPNLSVLIDNIGFVTPEPGTLSLMAAATTVLAFLRRRRPG